MIENRKDKLNKLLEAESLNNRATKYMVQGRYSLAEPLLIRSLKFLETKFGKKHPDVAGSLADLGGLYEVQGKHSQARASYKRSLAIR